MLQLIYSILKDICSWLRRRRRRLSPDEVVCRRQKWKQEFEDKISERRVSGLRGDVIIRDMKRVDNYPDDDKKGKGISPWFRVGILGTYHHGIQVSHHFSKVFDCFRTFSHVSILPTLPNLYTLTPSPLISTQKSA